MKRARRLKKLYRTFRKRFVRLRAQAVLASQLAAGPEREQAIAMLVINVQNMWSNFCRAYYLSCMAEARCMGGHEITCLAAGLAEPDAIGRAVTVIRPTVPFQIGTVFKRREEPAWHDSTVLIRLANAEAFSHRLHISAAFSTGTRTFSDLPKLRNYFAHRNDSTLRTARSVANPHGIPNAIRPSELCLSYALGRPQVLLLDMIDDLLFTGSFLCA